MNLLHGHSQTVFRTNPRADSRRPFPHLWRTGGGDGARQAGGREAPDTGSGGRDAKAA